MDSSQHQNSTNDPYKSLKQKYRPVFDRLTDLQERIGYRFNDVKHLYEALTHRSCLQELSGDPTLDSLPWNERLEFLGDSVLGLSVSKKLMKKNDGFAEGELSRIRASLVNEEALAEVAREIDLGQCLFLGKGARASGIKFQNSILADALEALIGAVFTDSDFDAADRVVQLLLRDRLAGDVKHLVQTDYKTALQELAQDRLKTTPQYLVVEESGLAHKKNFRVAVSISGVEYGVGQGTSKKRASQDAARTAMDHLLQNNLRERS